LQVNLEEISRGLLARIKVQDISSCTKLVIDQITKVLAVCSFAQQLAKCVAIKEAISSC
jgi:hypothetical protein